jgi:hypothetical protein
MLEVEGVNMAEECLLTWSELEGMNMAGIHMVEMEGKDMVKERQSKKRSKVEGMDMTTKVGLVEREHGGVVLVKHQINDRVERNRQTHQEPELGMWRLEGCLGGHTKFVSRDSNSL